MKKMCGEVYCCISEGELIRLDQASGGYPDRVGNDLRLATYFTGKDAARTYAKRFENGSTYYDMRAVTIKWQIQDVKYCCHCSKELKSCQGAGDGKGQRFACHPDCRNEDNVKVFRKRVDAALAERDLEVALRTSKGERGM